MCLWPRPRTGPAPLLHPEKRESPTTPLFLQSRNPPSWRGIVCMNYISYVGAPVQHLQKTRPPKKPRSKISAYIIRDY